MNILVALDGSEAAFNALRISCNIAARSLATVMAFYVNKGQEYTPEETGWAGITEKITDELESLGERVIQRSREIGREGGTDVAGIMSYGLPAAEILNYVYDHGIVKLIAVGHTSKGKAAREFVGSTTKTVVAWAKVPVLVTSSAVDFKEIVLPVEEPGSARKAAAFAGTLARSVGANVRILSVVPSAEAVIAVYRQIAEVPGISRYIEESQRAYDRLGEEASSAAREVLESMELRPPTIIRTGRPADEILAEATGEVLLVVGLRSGPSGRRLGPVARRLLDSRSAAIVFV